MNKNFKLSVFLLKNIKYTYNCDFPILNLLYTDGVQKLYSQDFDNFSDLYFKTIYNKEGKDFTKELLTLFLIGYFDFEEITIDNRILLFQDVYLEVINGVLLLKSHKILTTNDRIDNKFILENLPENIADNSYSQYLITEIFIMLSLSMDFKTITEMFDFFDNYNMYYSKMSMMLQISSLMVSKPIEKLHFFFDTEIIYKDEDIFYLYDWSIYKHKHVFEILKSSFHILPNFLREVVLKYMLKENNLLHLYIENKSYNQLIRDISFLRYLYTKYNDSKLLNSNKEIILNSIYINILTSVKHLTFSKEEENKILLDFKKLFENNDFKQDVNKYTEPYKRIYLKNRRIKKYINKQYT